MVPFTSISVTVTDISTFHLALKHWASKRNQKLQKHPDLNSQ